MKHKLRNMSFPNVVRKSINVSSSRHFFFFFVTYKHTLKGTYTHIDIRTRTYTKK